MRALVIAAFSTALVLAGCTKPAKEAKLEIRDAWVRLPAVAGRPGAGYFTLASGGSAVALVSVTSPQVNRVELHESMSHGGMTSMAPLPAVQVPQNASIAFAPGGKHAMLFEIDPAVKAGDRISFTFTFEPKMQIVADAEVLGPADAPPGRE